ncbi:MULTISPECIES: SDR family NAD(P)-dependent oxidoreductase [unclassified Tolypothrix]|uniref:SDR family NAD(P)-dependent oxidoreductase n=1 Tax=unclassified Tolypothrix TaxID=2649714 RepID=UPI0005EAB749|nr:MULTISPECIES: SDR family NAD(P)-dependent oxidoreductase [unclassified Tolypothrix]BAY88113.1 short-chain dehydrogenase/reductase SDR [Microchaete diplosiphon NIES-3275]EKE97474.1 short chain dehydrogenase [Tolypothrix sp. PCC 7601]MBE9086409.1 SDR family NAD(P)-dependent oxidoreductase [Tolypothrix sp. LEGE 11397]UYD28822.1 SDR family NAD(P)-dependent oxidoreductase [Tolypothrix sp. PCC 7712]UYD35266.1 SDR family NAD(P)-dependent oxidoreductase [Tolypothrix sp. PCC 7601]
MKYLQGKVTLVTGATRGIGKGIAIGLGEAGATVYITGRSLNNSNAQDDIGGNLNDTKLAVEAAGGVCIPIAVDHSDDEQVRSLFQRIEQEQDGKLDLLVNNVFSGVPALRKIGDQPFWDFDASLWDACNNVGLRSHYVASIFAARMMAKRQQGLICNISSWGGLSYIFGAAYGAGKAACDRLATDMAVELKPYNVASISLWPGIVGTEHISSIAAEMADSKSTDPKKSMFSDRYNWETPLLTGRVIAKLANDSTVISRTGHVHIVAELAQRYGVVDQEGNLPVSLRSLRFLLPMAIPQLRKNSWLIPDIKVPWSLLIVSSLSSPKI